MCKVSSCSTVAKNLARCQQRGAKQIPICGNLQCPSWLQRSKDGGDSAGSHKHQPCAKLTCYWHRLETGCSDLELKAYSNSSLKIGIKFVIESDQQAVRQALFPCSGHCLAFVDWGHFVQIPCVWLRMRVLCWVMLHNGLVELYTKHVKFKLIETLRLWPVHACQWASVSPG